MNIAKIAAILREAFGFTTSEVDPVTGRIDLLVAGAVVGSLGENYTWATRPAASGRAGAVIRINDIGQPGVGSYWVSDGTYWRPLNGRVTLAKQSGSLATPVSTFTGVTSSVFTLTPAPVIPAGMLIPGSAQIIVEAAIRRIGANGTALASVHFGTQKTAGDNVAYQLLMGANNNLDLLVNPTIFVSEASRYTGTSWQTRGGSGNGAVYNDRTGAVNTLVEMGVTLSITSANAADQFSLVGYSVDLKM